MRFCLKIPAEPVICKDDGTYLMLCFLCRDEMTVGMCFLSGVTSSIESEQGVAAASLGHWHCYCNIRPLTMSKRAPACCVHRLLVWFTRVAPELGGTSEKFSSLLSGGPFISVKFLPPLQTLKKACDFCITGAGVSLPIMPLTWSIWPIRTTLDNVTYRCVRRRPIKTQMWCHTGKNKFC